MGAPLAGERKIVWCRAGLRRILGVALALAPMPAAAQILDPPSRGAGPRPAPASPHTSRRYAPLEDGRPERLRRWPFGPGETSPDGRCRNPRRRRAGSGGRADPRRGAKSGAGDAAGAEDDGWAKPRPRRLAVPQDGDPVAGRSRRRRRRTVSSTSASRRRPSRGRKTSPRSTCARPRTSARSSASPPHTIRCCWRRAKSTPCSATAPSAASRSIRSRR